MTEWRVLQLEEHNAYLNMAIDESILEHIRDGMSQPTIRFYRWNPSAVSIGRFQGMNDEVNVARCRELGVDCVRRITGGGAVYHDSGGELTYSIIGTEELFPKGIRESYRLICGWVINGLKSIGIDAEFAPINDITSNGKKISGNAQTRREGVLLQHGTILYRLDVAKMFSLLNISKEKISDKMIRSAEERVTSVHSQTGASFEELYSAVMRSLTEYKDHNIGVLSKSELERMSELEKVYSSEAWNFFR
ncbi:MAG: lipoate--protein ligase family protein [Candidatus Marsarchaeota archaeon]|nr:lipoate--protein ligase family protein [Candidatus Marsarchaeota archaeon]